MAETPNTTTPVIDPAAHNAEVIAKGLKQNVEVSTTPAPEAIKNTGDSLDALAQQITEKNDKADEPIIETAPVAPVVPAEPTAEEKQKSEIAARAAEFFKDAPSLPTNASPKSSEAFSQVKIKAAQEISSLESKLKDYETKVKELEEKTKNPVPESVTKELEDLRQFRAKIDIDADPKFKTFDTDINHSRDFVYSQLKKAGLSQNVVDKMKEFGGPDQTNMENVLAAIKDPDTKRAVETALAEIERTKYRREQAVQDAKKNIVEYTKERQKNYEAQANAHNTATEDLFKSHTSKMTWLNEITPDDKADATKKGEIAEYNSWVKDVKNTIEVAKRDDSPEMRAIMLAGMAQLLQYERQFKINLAVATNTAKEHEAKVSSLNSQVKDLTDKLERIKSSSTSRLRQSGADPSGKSIPAPNKNYFSQRSGDALDAVAQQVMEAKAAQK